MLDPDASLAAWFCLWLFCILAKSHKLLPVNFSAGFW